jgi:casein kinase 1
MLIFLIKGGLPWQNLNVTNEEEKIKAVGQMKMKMDSLEICKGLPVEFARYSPLLNTDRYLDYVRKLNFKS